MITLKKLASNNPFKTGVILVLIAMFFRILDIFVLRLDEKLGEIILSKTLGIFIILFFLKLTGKKISFLKLNFDNYFTIFIIGFLLTLLSMTLGYFIEYFIFINKNPKFMVEAIDPKAKVTGSFIFAIFLIIGNIINSFMEEGLFRGILIPLFKEKYSIKMSIILQGIIFGIWHIPWAFKWYITGMVKGIDGFLVGFIINFLPMILMGIILGIMYHFTLSLWTPIISHFFINSILNLVHISINGQIDTTSTIRMAIFQTILTLSIPLIVKFCIKYNKFNHS